jgi:hypothetical protein
LSRSVRNAGRLCMLPLSTTTSGRKLCGYKCAQPPLVQAAACDNRLAVQILLSHPGLHMRRPLISIMTMSLPYMPPSSNMFEDSGPAVALPRR